MSYYLELIELIPVLYKRSVYVDWVYIKISYSVWFIFTHFFIRFVMVGNIENAL